MTRTSRLIAAVMLAAVVPVLADTPTEALESLRRSTAAQSDAAVVVQRYNQFITRNASTPAAEEAKKDLAVWQDRLDRKLVRVGQDWITQADRDAMKAKSTELTDRAAELIQKNDPKSAEPILAQVLEVDPANAPALYLRGLVEADAGKLPAARKDFEGVLVESPYHGPTLNNLAVIAWRQKHMAEALNRYEQATHAIPAEQVLLDNVVEAWATGHPAWKQPIGERLRQQFNQQEPLLQKRMAERPEKLTRWGSRWLTDEEMTKAAAQEKEIEEKVKPLQAEYDALRKAIDDYGVRIADNGRRITDINRASQLGYNRGYNNGLGGGIYNNPQIGNTGNTYINSLNGTLPYNQGFDSYSLEMDNKALYDQRTQAQRKLAPLARQMEDIRRSLNTQKYTGAQKLIGVEGTPGKTYPAKVPAGSPATTQAAP